MWEISCTKNVTSGLWQLIGRSEFQHHLPEMHLKFGRAGTASNLRPDARHSLNMRKASGKKIVKEKPGALVYCLGSCR